MATIAYRLVGNDLMLFLCGDASPTDSEWQEYVRFMEELARRMRASGNLLKLLVFADDGGLNPKQRAVRRVRASRQPCVALARGVCTLAASCCPRTRRAAVMTIASVMRLSRATSSL